MSVASKNVAVFGSTGSIGKNALEVIAASSGRLKAIALSARGKLDLLLEQAQQFQPRWVVAADKDVANRFDWKALPVGTELLTGADALAQVAREGDVDIVLAGIVGSAGLRSTW